MKNVRDIHDVLDFGEVAFDALASVMGEKWTPAPSGGRVEEDRSLDFLQNYEELRPWEEKIRSWSRFGNWLEAMIEHGVSDARAIFAFNSTNVEGWGLYSEWLMLPYMPEQAKLISLQLRLLRAARAFLDPELQEGKMTPEQALQVLQNDVVVSKAFATEEVDRFTFRMPGQAVSYFDGYTRLREIRSEAESALGSKFNAQRFHDFILSQGLLPPSLLRRTVMSDFVSRE